MQAALLALGGLRYALSHSPFPRGICNAQAIGGCFRFNAASHCLSYNGVDLRS